MIYDYPNSEIFQITIELPNREEIKLQVPSSYFSSSEEAAHYAQKIEIRILSSLGIYLCEECRSIMTEVPNKRLNHIDWGECKCPNCGKEGIYLLNGGN